MRLKHREIVRQLTEIRQWCDELERDLPTVSYIVATNTDDGVQGVSYDSKGRSSGPPDPVGEKACLLRRDDVATAARDYQKAVLAAVTELRRAGKKSWALLPLPADEAKALTEQDEINDQGTIQGCCINQNCGRLVARTANDRLHGGRCGACRMFLTRNGYERPRHLCEQGADALDAEALALTEGVITEGAA